VNQQEVRAVIVAVLAEQQEHAKAVAQEAVSAVLLSLGIHEDEHKELRADFQHLRRWRKSVEQAQSLTFKAVIGTLATGFVALVWMGATTFFGK
jgi:hypothetical protein